MFVTSWSKLEINFTRLKDFLFYSHLRHNYKNIENEFTSIIRSCDRPSRHRFSLVSLGPRANAEMVPFYDPSCRYMLPV